MEYSDRQIVRSGHLLDTITEQFTDLLLVADNLIQVARTQLYDSISIYGEDRELTPSSASNEVDHCFS